MNQRRLQIFVILLLLLYVVVNVTLSWPARESAAIPLGTPAPSATTETRTRRTPNPIARILQPTVTPVDMPEAAPTAKPELTSTPTAQQGPKPTATAQPALTAPASGSMHEPNPTRESPTSKATATLPVANTLTPAASAEPTTTAAPTPTAIIHIVAKGDVLSAIAKRYNVTVAAIVVANDLTDPDKLTIDQVLIIPLQPTPSATPTPSQ